MIVLESGETGEYVEVVKQKVRAHFLLMAVLFVAATNGSPAPAQNPAYPAQIIVWEPPQWRTAAGPYGNVLVWDGYWRQQVYNQVPVVPSVPLTPAKNDELNRIKRLPKYKDFGEGVKGELIEEDGDEERITRHRGTNRGRYRLYRYVPGHRDAYGDWIPGHKEDLGEEEVGQDVDEEYGKRKNWSYQRR